jgi:hypothetical protein
MRLARQPDESPLDHVHEPRVLLEQLVSRRGRRPQLRYHFSTIGHHDDLPITGLTDILAETVLELTNPNFFHGNNVATGGYIVNKE